MEIKEFINCFDEVFEETPIDSLTPETKFKELDEWGSLLALSVMGMVDEKFNKSITGKEIRDSKTLQDLYNIVSKK